MVKTNNESAQEAHEAIRPCDITVDESDLEGCQQKLYKSIRTITMSSQMSKEEFITHTIQISNDIYEDEFFESQFKETTFKGYTILQEKPQADLGLLKHIKKGNSIDYEIINGNSDISKPKSLRYNEANLIKQLDKLEIGRPSTYSSMVSVVQDRLYVEKKDLPGIKANVKEFMLTRTHGVKIESKEKYFKVKKINWCPHHYMVNDFMQEHFPQIIETEFTRSWNNN